MVNPIYSHSILFLTSEAGVGSQSQAPAALTPGQSPGTLCRGAGWTGMEK
jgi:hypothetical protein